MPPVEYAIREFLHLQYYRTYRAITKARDFIQKFHQKAFENDSHAPDVGDLSDHSMLMNSLQLADASRSAVQDLKFTLLRNSTNIPFLTCDHPVFHTNRFYIQRHKALSFGIMSTGCLFYMPLSPKWAAMLYDGLAYTVPTKTDLITQVCLPTDAHLLNGMMVLNADQNLYFSTDIASHIEMINRFRPLRIIDGTITQRYEQTGEIDGGKQYEIEGPHTVYPGPGSWLIVTSEEYPRPPKWPKFISFRSPVKTLYDGSAAGYVRPTARGSGMDGAKLISV